MGNTGTLPFPKRESGLRGEIATLIEQRRPQMLRMAARSVGANNAEDCVGEAIYRVYRSLGTYSDVSEDPAIRLRTRYGWILTILRNVLRDAATAAKRNPEYTLAFVGGDDGIDSVESYLGARGASSVASDPEDGQRIEREELLETRRRLLRNLSGFTTLSERERLIFNLYLEGKGFAQIATVMGLEPNAVRAHYSAAVRRLREEAEGRTPASQEGAIYGVADYFAFDPRQRKKSCGSPR